jgi:hypothetical protein
MHQRGRAAGGALRRPRPESRDWPPTPRGQVLSSVEDMVRDRTICWIKRTRPEFRSHPRHGLLQCRPSVTCESTLSPNKPSTPRLSATTDGNGPTTLVGPPLRADGQATLQLPPIRPGYHPAIVPVTARAMGRIARRGHLPRDCRKRCPASQRKTQTGKDCHEAAQGSMGNAPTSPRDDVSSHRSRPGRPHPQTLTFACFQGRSASGLRGSGSRRHRTMWSPCLIPALRCHPRSAPTQMRRPCSRGEKRRLEASATRSLRLPSRSLRSVPPIRGRGPILP